MLSLTSKSWSPYVAGIVIGLLQIPAFLLIETALGTSSSYVTVGGLLVSYVEPLAEYRYDKIRFDVTSGALGIKIPQGEFVDIGEDTTIRLGKATESVRRDLPNFPSLAAIFPRLAGQERLF